MQLGEGAPKAEIVAWNSSRGGVGGQANVRVPYECTLGQWPSGVT